MRNNKLYQDYLKSNEWRTKSNGCKKLADYKCDICGSEENLHAHHLTYENVGNENIEKDLQCLCSICHQKQHHNDFNQKYKKIKGGFTMIYKAEYDNALENIVKSNLDLKLVNAIKDKFTYKQTDVFISTKSLSFRFGTSQRKVQKVIKSMCEAKLLYKNGETYRLNPFMFIPYHANGEELQNEWKELMLNEETTNE